MLGLVKRLMLAALDKRGYVLSKKAADDGCAYDTGELNLNIGSGRYPIRGFVSYDLETDHYHEGNDDSFVRYNIREDDLDLPDESVGNIYISHVIEHIEDAHVFRFLRDARRVLKRGGVLRVCCPDARFLYDVSQFENDFWLWREEWFHRQSSQEEPKPNQRDYFVREVSTPLSRFYDFRIPRSNVAAEDIANMSYSEALEYLNRGLEFRLDHPGDHINAWDFEKLERAGKEAGFQRIVLSKPGGSVSRYMQGEAFDRTAPHMSLYVEMIK